MNDALPARSMPTLKRLLARPYASVDEAATEICHAVREALGMGVAYVSRIEGDLLTIVAADDGLDLGLRPGFRAPLAETFCGRALSGSVPRATADAASGPYADVPARAGLGASSYAMVPLRDGDGEVVGTLCGLDREPVPVDEESLRLLDLLGCVLSRELELEKLRARDTRRAAHQTAVARLSAQALVDDDIERVLRDGIRLVAHALDVEDCHILEMLPDRRLRPWVGTLPMPPVPAAEGVPEPIALPVREDGLDGATLRAPGPLLLEDLGTDPRARDVHLLHEAGHVCGVTAALRSSTEVYGLLGAFSAVRRDFGPEDLLLLQKVTNLLAGVIARRRAENDLRWRSRLDRTLTVASTELIRLASGELEAGVRRTLAAVGELLGADRGLVLLARPEEGTWDKTYEWQARGVGAALPGPFGVRDADAPWLIERLGQGEVVYLPDLQDLPPEAGPEREFFTHRQAKSLVCLPMLADGRLIGVVALSTHRERACWPAEVVRRLRPVGDMIANAISRDAVAARLQASDERYRLLVDNVGDVIVHVDREGQLSFVNRTWTELTGLTLEETLGRGVFDNLHPDDHAVAADHMAAAMRGEDGEAREVRFLTRHGVRWMAVKGRAVFDDSGTFHGLSGLLHDVTDRRQAQERVQAALEEAERARDEAEAARDDAQRASGAKSEFLSRTSHELRTPLNAILGFGQLLELGDLAEEDAESVTQILRAGRHLLDLINEVLEISRIETGRLSLSLEPVGLRESVQESVDLVRTAAASRNIELRVGSGVREAVVVADRQRLKQVLVNLLSNAVKYNRDGGQVEITAEPLPAELAPHRDESDGSAQPWLRVRVVDTGIGIPADRLADVWVPFERLGAELTGVEGSGVGLALTKSLVEAMGGRIDVTSTAGAGSTFVVDLPATTVPDQGGDARPPEPEDDGEPCSTVLYVEDNPSNVVLVRRILSRRPHTRLVVASDGVTGLGMLDQVRPDLVLLDLHLPGLDGEAVLAALRTDPDRAIRDVPVVVITADATDGTEARLRQAGASDFLNKPLDVQRFLTIVEAHLQASCYRPAPVG